MRTRLCATEEDFQKVAEFLHSRGYAPPNFAGSTTIVAEDESGEILTFITARQEIQVGLYPGREKEVSAHKAALRLFKLMEDILRGNGVFNYQVSISPGSEVLKRIAERSGFVSKNETLFTKQLNLNFHH